MNKSDIKNFLKKIPFLRLIKRVMTRLFKEAQKFINGLSARKKCYVCGHTFYTFTKFKGGSKNRPQFRVMINSVGSDLDNFRCMYCGSHDRERHLYMYFDKLALWEKMQDRSILHFAPERNLHVKIRQQKPSQYIMADLYPANTDIQKVDATDIPFSDNTFDALIANHILEHIPDYEKAMSEFYRVIKPGGFAILQTPYSKLLTINFEDEGINSDALRTYFHGQADHVRTFAERHFLSSLEKAGFSLEIKKHDEMFEGRDAFYFGVPANEDLIMVKKVS